MRCKCTPWLSGERDRRAIGGVKYEGKAVRAGFDGRTGGDTYMIPHQVKFGNPHPKNNLPHGGHNPPEE